MPMVLWQVAEGVNFEGHYGRAVVIMGVPYQYTKSKTLMARMEFTREKFRIREQDFLSFDAVRQASQCLGRVIRSKQDYGLMVLADYRYGQADKRMKLPNWIQQVLPAAHYSLAVDVAINKVRQFLIEMARPPSLLSDTLRRTAVEGSSHSEKSKEESGTNQNDSNATQARPDTSVDAEHTVTNSVSGYDHAGSAKKRPRIEL